MSESKFLKIQQDVCTAPEEKEQEPDRICPTCVPQESYFVPQWYRETDPWLNLKTCEYTVAVTVNQNGTSLRSSDLATIFGTLEDVDNKEALEIIKRS